MFRRSDKNSLSIAPSTITKPHLKSHQPDLLVASVTSLGEFLVIIAVRMITWKAKTNKSIQYALHDIKSAIT